MKPPSCPQHTHTPLLSARKPAPLDSYVSRLRGPSPSRVVASRLAELKWAPGSGSVCQRRGVSSVSVRVSRGRVVASTCGRSCPLHASWHACAHAACCQGRSCACATDDGRLAAIGRSARSLLPSWLDISMRSTPCVRPCCPLLRNHLTNASLAHLGQLVIVLALSNDVEITRQDQSGE